MSRQCKAQVRGVIDVLLVCDQCDKRVWWPLQVNGEDPECLEWAAREQSGWLREDDCIVCSDECAAVFWSDDAW